ncbi:PTS transporter subunit EIIC [Paenibacillus sp. JNUCC31]|uniref:PTS transporter subunit EIIC n=1 Tax=Paenibacillus sp. JNUCC-31 TaxID=2777983 RepID=UPI00177BF0FA|nr:PTS transporter subunit EIIC [Paenibacillus sp. JNUCC-31]QOS80470.1 PTS transporter subunit EIIC [Paenibacillus sp. JNUCC-31]
MKDRFIEQRLKLAGGKDNIGYVQRDMSITTLTLHDYTRMDLSVPTAPDLDTDISITDGKYCVKFRDEDAYIYNTLLGMGVEQQNRNSMQETTIKGKKTYSALYFISDVFRPLMPVLLGAAILKIILGMITVINSLSTEDASLIGSQTWMIWNSIGDSAFYLLPILIAISTAYRLKSNLYVATAIGGLMLYPQMTTVISSGEEVHFMGVPLGSQTLFFSAPLWIIVTIGAASWLEKRVERISPSALKGILAPALILMIVVPIVLLALGPVGTWVDEHLSGVIESLLNHAPVVLIMLLGAIMSLLMITGLHYWLFPILINELMTNGFTIVLPAMLAAFVAQAGAALAAGLRSEQSEFRKLAFWASGTALFGVTEPAMFAVNMRRRAFFYAAMLGGMVGGLYFGLLSVKALVIGGSVSLLDIPFYIEEGTFNMLHTCIGVCIAFGGSGALAYWMAGRTANHKSV